MAKTSFEQSIKKLSMSELKEELEYFEIGCGKKTRKGHCPYINEYGIIKVYCSSCVLKLKFLRKEYERR